MLVCLKVFAGFLLVGIWLQMALQVFCRYVLNHSLSWPDELSAVFLALLTFSGGAIGMLYDDHIGFTTLLEKCGERWGRIFQAFSDCVILCFLGVLIVFSIPLIIRTWSQTLLGVPIPRGLTFLLMWIGVVAMFYYKLVRVSIVRHLLNRCDAQVPKALTGREEL